MPYGSLTRFWRGDTGLNAGQVDFFFHVTIMLLFYINNKLLYQNVVFFENI
jgi:hypothetical protein